MTHSLYIGDTMTDEKLTYIGEAEMTFETVNKSDLTLEERYALEKFERVTDLIEATNGKVFGAKVVKKNGETRTFNARTYADSFDRIDSGIIVVIEMNAAKKGNPYRSINIDGVLELHINGDVHTFKEAV